MSQRPLRVGDVLDDYCPKDRRVTDHVVVAMVGDDVRQVRCSTCDADHDYKHARVPRPKRSAATAVLYDQVLANVTAGHTPPAVTDVEVPMEAPREASPRTEASAPDREDDEALIAAWISPSRRVPAASVTPEPGDEDARDEDEADDARGNVAEEGPLNRQLIRAQLPRTGGYVSQPTRQTTDFTIRQPSGGRAHRGGGRPARGGSPHGGPRHGQGHSGGPQGARDARGGAHRGQPHGHGSGRPPQQRQGGGGKRSR